jgi:hypothetical protein
MTNYINALQDKKYYYYYRNALMLMNRGGVGAGVGGVGGLWGVPLLSSPAPPVSHPDHHLMSKPDIIHTCQQMA